MAKIWDLKICCKCKKCFTPRNNIQKFCLSPCRSSQKQKTIAEINFDWVNISFEERQKRYRKCKENFSQSKVRVI